MAEVQPLRTLRYDLAAAGLARGRDRAALRRDRRRACAPRSLPRSPFNVVEIDLPRADGDDPYLHAQTTIDGWRDQGVLVREREPALWVLRRTTPAPTASRAPRRGFFARVRVEDYGPGRIRPHERTHPGPKEDRLRLTRATRTNLSPIFSLFPDPDGRARGGARAGDRAASPSPTATDHDGTVNTLWRLADAERDRAPCRPRWPAASC